MNEPIETNNPDDIIAAGKLAAKLITLNSNEAKAMTAATERVRARYAEKRRELASQYPEMARRLAGVE